MKSNRIKTIAAVTMMALCTMVLSSCKTQKKVVNTKEITSSVVLDDQEKPIGEWVNCTACDHTGLCKRCNGTGKIDSKKCPACKGSGKCTVCEGQGGYRKNN